MPKVIGGICPIVAAPFDRQGRVDLDSLAHLVRHLCGTGVQGLTLFGLATEFYKLTDQERARMMRVMLDNLSGDVAGIISITDHAWEVAVERARAAEEAGADALMLFPPFFLGPGAPAIAEHVARVARAVSLPIIVQYAPNQSGVRIDPAVWVQMQEQNPNIRWVKVETQPPEPYISQLLALSGGRLGALVGYAGLQMIAALERGAAGVQPGCSLSEIYVALYRRWQAGDLAGARAIYAELLPWISWAMQSVELIIRVEKVILARRGLIATDYCRAPAYALDAGQQAELDRHLERLAHWLTVER